MCSLQETRISPQEVMLECVKLYSREDMECQLEHGSDIELRLEEIKEVIISKLRPDGREGAIQIQGLGVQGRELLLQAGKASYSENRE